MRIAQLTGWYPPHSMGGTEVYVGALSRALRGRGHEVTVAGPLTGIERPQTAADGNIRVLRYPIPSDPTRDEARGRVLARGTEQLLEWIGAWKPDIVHAHSLTTGLHVPELAAAAAGGARIVVTLHLPALSYICQRGTLAEWGRSACDGIRRRRRCAACALEGRGAPKPLAAAVARTPFTVSRRAMGWRGPLATGLSMPALIEELGDMQRALFDVADAVVALNTSSVRILIGNNAPAAKVRLNALGISHVARPKRSPDEAPTRRPVAIGFFGRLSPEKGIGEFLDAIAMLRRDLPLRFVFHGIVAGDTGARFAAMIRSAATARPGIELRPALPPSGVAAALAAIDVLCAPSRWFENGPTIALEAIAAGTPVIGTRFGAFSDYVQDGVNGRLIAPGDRSALASALEAVASDPGGTVDRWRRNLPRVRTMTEIARDYDDLYGELCSSAPVGVAR